MDVERGIFNRTEIVKERAENKDVIDEIMKSEYEESKSVRDNLMERQFDEMLSTNNIELKTDLSPRAIIELSRAGVILSRFDIPSLAKFTDLYQKYCVSKKRKGREELVQLTTNAVSRPLEEETLIDRAKVRLL